MKLQRPFPAVSADTIISLFLKPYALASSKLLCVQPWAETEFTKKSGFLLLLCEDESGRSFRVTRSKKRSCEFHRAVCVCGGTLSRRRQQNGAFCGRRWQRVGELPMQGEFGGQPFTKLWRKRNKKLTKTFKHRSVKNDTSHQTCQICRGQRS